MTGDFSLLILLALSAVAGVALALRPAIALGLLMYAFVLKGGLALPAYVDLTGMLLVSLGVAVLLYIFSGRRLYFRASRYDYIVLLFTALLFASAFFGERPDAGINKASRFVLLVGLPYLFARLVLVTREQVEVFLRTIVVAGTFVAAIIVLNALLGDSILPDISPARAYFFNANPVITGIFMMTATIIAVVPWIARAKFPPPHVLGAIVLLASALVLTGSRGPILSLIGALAGASITALGCRPTRVTMAISVVAVAFFALSVGPGFGWLPNSARFQALITQDPHDRSIENRIRLREEAVDMFTSHPITGIGTGAMGKYPHNLFLEVAAENGIIGVAVLVLLLWVVVERGWRYAVRPYAAFAHGLPVTATVLLVIVGLLIEAQFSSGLTGHKDLFAFLAIAVNLPIVLQPDAYRRTFEQGAAPAVGSTPAIGGAAQAGLQR